MHRAMTKAGERCKQGKHVENQKQINDVSGVMRTSYNTFLSTE